MDVFEDDTNSILVKNRLRENHPHIPAGLDDAEFDELVRLSLEKGRFYQVERVEAVVIIARFIYRLGREFDDFPEIRATLDNKENPPDENFETLSMTRGVEEWGDLYESSR